MKQPTNECIAIACTVYTFICFGIMVAFATILGIGISDDNGSNHAVNREPRYKFCQRVCLTFIAPGVSSFDSWDRIKSAH